MSLNTRKTSFFQLRQTKPLETEHMIIKIIQKTDFIILNFIVTEVVKTKKKMEHIRDLQGI